MRRYIIIYAIVIICTIQLSTCDEYTKSGLNTLMECSNQIRNVKDFAKIRLSEMDKLNNMASNEKKCASNEIFEKHEEYRQIFVDCVFIEALHYHNRNEIRPTESNYMFISSKFTHQIKSLKECTATDNDKLKALLVNDIRQGYIDILRTK